MMDSHLIFQLRGNQSSSIDHSADQIEEGNEYENQEERNILCQLWKGNKLGAAYYNLTDNLLYVYEEYMDYGPQFPILKRLYREVRPKYTVCVGSSTDSFIKVLIDTINDDYDQGANTTVSDLRSLPPNFYILSMKEYSYEICKALLQQVNISSFTEPDTNDILREIYVQSLINFDYKMSVYAAGALVKYLDKNWAFYSPEKELQIMYIHQVTMKNHVLIDWNSFNAFQIFQMKFHDAGFMRGIQSNSREGLSIYKLFSSHCKSRIGQMCLRNLLLNPVFDINKLNKRLDFIEFALQPCHKEFIESLQDNIKYLVDINIILHQIQNSKAKSSNWQSLSKTIYHTILINELSSPHRSKSQLLSELNNAISSNLIGLHQSIQKAFDFSSKFQTGRPTIKYGLDTDLDAKKMQRQDISKHVTAAARIAVEELPDFLTECAVVYLPEMGHLITIREWEPNCNPEELAVIGYQFMFTVGGAIHYKSPLCAELDRRLGDINAEIIAHENRIIERMSGFVLKYNKDIREPLKLIALIDSLISLAKVADERNFIKPTLNNESYQEIIGGRHPLMEEMFPGFVSNDYFSGREHSRMKIITGPNGSGKSVYLKQIGIIIYLAHVGSYLPVTKANIGMVHSIHFRIATESVCVRLSAFMMDLTQFTQAIFNAKPSSLIIMDEFGKGTAGKDGVILTAAVLRNFSKQNQGCPHTLLSTHYQQIITYLPNTPIIEYQRMSYGKDDGETMVFLFKLEIGVSESFAFNIAEQVTLDSKIIERAKQIRDCLVHQKPLKPISLSGYQVLPQNIPRETLHSFLSNIKLPDSVQDWHVQVFRS